MTTKIRIMPHSASKGARKLADALKEEGFNVMRLKRTGSNYRGYPSHVLINWGCSSRRTIREGIEMLNEPEGVEKAQNKVSTFENLTSVPTPDWTTDRETAASWIQEGYKVYCRTLTRGSEGRGIVVATTTDEIVSAPLYTKGLEIAREVRVHVFMGEVIDFSQKKKMGSERREQEGIEEVDMDVRNHKNGWIFARSDVTLPDDAKDMAVSAVEALGLDFGAVDMVITPQEACRVLEINTAPGLEGTTLERYKNAVKAYVETRR